MKKIIMFSGGVETLEFFSFELAEAFKRRGKKVFFYDLLNEAESYRELSAFCGCPDEIKMITFNFRGIAGEDYLYREDGTNFWDEHKIACYNIVADHPLYYHKYLENVPKKYYQISIDRYHESYMKRYFPQISLAGFLPLGGTKLDTGEKRLSMSERTMELTFAGNMMPLESLEEQLQGLDQDTVGFYHSIRDEMIKNPSLRIEEYGKQRIEEELGKQPDEILKACFHNMMYLDLYVRYYFRHTLISAIADAGIKIHLFGSGFSSIRCKHPENLILHGGVNSRKCLEAFSQSRLSLNIMPWFKNGAHDRIFSSQLNGAVCISDTSEWLLKEFSDEKEIVFFDLKKPEELPETIKQMLSSREKMEYIAEMGFQRAQKYHTWEARAELLQ